MKNKTLKLVSFFVAVVCCLLVFLSAVVPFLQSTSTSSSSTSVSSIYFHQLFSATVISSTSSTMVGSVSFGSIVVLILFLVAPLSLLSDKKITKALGLCVDLSMLSVAVYFLDIVKEIRTSIGSLTTTKISTPGLIILLVAAIIVILYAIFDLIVAFFGEKIVNALKSPSKSTKELLDENEDLFKAGYINEEERDMRKAKILEGK